MKRVRAIEVVTCCICGEEVDKINTREIFTGRVKYICFKCEALANNEVMAVKSNWQKNLVKEKNSKGMEKHRTK